MYLPCMEGHNIYLRIVDDDNVFEDEASQAHKITCDLDKDYDNFDLHIGSSSSGKYKVFGKARSKGKINDGTFKIHQAWDIK